MKTFHAQANLGDSPERIPDAVFGALTFIAFLGFAILLYCGSPT